MMRKRFSPRAMMAGLKPPTVVEGVVDGREGSHVRGWAWRPSRPQDPVDVEVWCGQALVGRGLADQFRPDLEAAGKRQGRCAFDIALDEDFAGEVVVRTAPADGAVELAGNPVVLTRTPRSGVVQALVTLPGWIGGVDHIGPGRVSGWVRWRSHPGVKPELELWVDGAPALRFTAEGWRVDLEEMWQGDGRGAFDVPLPLGVRDGAAHTFDLRLADGGQSVLGKSLYVFVPKAEAADGQPEATPAPKPAARQGKAPGGAPELSVIVNFYNMPREAGRTLTSLSRDYQTGIEDLAYEVICVDNGSNPPIDPAWVQSFGPEFRLIRPSQPHPAPCKAMNAAAREAKGRHLAVMIDGAHVLTPGVFREALPHLRAQSPAVVAVRHWFVGGDQRWLSQAGYTREHEDVLFDRIAWPRDGYKLFRIGTPIGESPNAWFDGLSESNCLFLPAEDWREIGGFEEGFVQPGGGLANLDLLKRAASVAEGGVVCLLGEATFHQYHGGTTTNVNDAEKDARVELYDREYAQLRGGAFVALKPDELRLAGRMRQDFAINVRQRPMYPAAIGITEMVRPASSRDRRDLSYDNYLPGFYAEMGQHAATRWGGEPVGLGATDLINIQDLIHASRPTAIVTTSTSRALLRFVDAICQLEQLGGTPIILACDRPMEDLPGRVTRVAGSPWERETQRQIGLHLGDAEEVLVLFEGPDRPGAPIEELFAFAEFVSYGSYLVYLNTALGQPYLGYSNRWPAKAIRMLTCGGRYAIDRNMVQTMGSTCPKGYIRRVGGLIELVDDVPGLDDLDEL